MRHNRLNGVPSFQKPNFYPRLGQTQPKSLVNDLDSTMARRPAPPMPAPVVVPTPAPIAPPPIIATPIIPSVTTDSYGLRSQPYQKSDPISKFVQGPKVMPSIPPSSYTPASPMALNKSYSSAAPLPTISLPVSYGAPLNKTYSTMAPVTKTVSVSYNPTTPASNAAFNAALNQGISYKAPTTALNVSALNKSGPYGVPLPQTTAALNIAALNKGITYNVPVPTSLTQTYSPAPVNKAAGLLLQGFGDISTGLRDNLGWLGLAGIAIYFLRFKK